MSGIPLILALTANRSRRYEWLPCTSKAFPGSGSSEKLLSCDAFPAALSISVLARVTELGSLRTAPNEDQK